MKGRRQILGAIGLGSLLAGLTAAVPGEASATDAKPGGSASTSPERRAEYKVFSVSAGDSVEEAFNAAARAGFRYAGSANRYGQTEFIFVKWTNVGSTGSAALSS